VEAGRVLAVWATVVQVAVVMAEAAVAVAEVVTKAQQICITARAWSCEADIDQRCN
jgi:hypothetical protein